MAARRPKKVEIGLRLDDMVVLREAGRIGRAALVNQLRTLKIEMQAKITTVEKVDDALSRLDVAIAKAAVAYGVDFGALAVQDAATEEG